MINKIFKWAYDNGVDIRLEAQSSVYSYAETHRYPKITFSKDNFHQSVFATDLERLYDIIEHTHSQIFVNLCMKPLDLND